MFLERSTLFEKWPMVGCYFELFLACSVCCGCLEATCIVSSAITHTINTVPLALNIHLLKKTALIRSVVPIIGSAIGNSKLLRNFVTTGIGGF